MFDILLTGGICDDGLESACPISQSSVIFGALFLGGLALQPFVVRVDVVEPAIKNADIGNMSKLCL